MKDIQYGEIITFNPVTGYGFIKPDTGGPDMFFRVEAGDLLKINNGKVVFAGESANIVSYFDTELSCPKERDLVVFTISKGKQGKPKASRWCYQFMLSNVNLYLEKQEDRSTVSVSPWMFMSTCDYCNKVLSFYGKSYESCKCFEDLMKDPMDVEPDDDYTFVTLPDGKIEAILNNYTETNLGDTPGGFCVIE